ncbi:MAG: pyridoxamine 5'-phosphate oxidase family protein [Candidatus Cloacimonetes bacterium]|nr:pyridoxamine 5'-phosphate oxidase family protein [Candidatus Cloacimonadota bacterium]
MRYSNFEVRRQDRLLEETKARSLLKNGEFGVMSVLCKKNGVYGFPINYVWDEDYYIYLHCAPEGKKLRCIDENINVSFCIVGRTNVIPDKFTTEYESIILECTAERGLSDDERMSALSLFLDKYCPNDKEMGMKYASSSFQRTEIIRLKITKWSGKCKNVFSH